MRPQLARSSLLPSLLALAGAAAAQQHDAPSKPNVGYTDTPMLPGSRWRVHDVARPHPKVVDPGPAASQQPPADAIVLFSGSDLAAFTGKDGKAGWQVADGCMTVNGTGDIQTVREFSDCQLHVEWAAPKNVQGDSQGRYLATMWLDQTKAPFKKS